METTLSKTETQKRYEDKYKSLWDKFWQELELEGINPKNGPSPHLPVCGDFSNYEASPYKIAVVGIDAYGWGNNLQQYKKYSIEEYIKECVENCDVSNRPKNSVFWNYIFKFLGKFYNTNWRDLREDAENTIIQSLVWAEVNSIGKDEKTNTENWDKIQKAGRVFDKAEHVLNTFQPDIMLLLNYSETSFYWDYLPNWEFKETIGCYPSDADYNVFGKTHIYWSRHPRNLSDDMIDVVLKSIVQNRIFPQGFPGDAEYKLQS